MASLAKFYPNGMPLYWQFEVSGKLKSAVRHYFETVLGQSAAMPAEEQQMVCDYCRYWINAPCWGRSPAFRVDEQGATELNQLRERAKTLASVESIKRWVDECLDFGMDPF